MFYSIVSFKTKKINVQHQVIIIFITVRIRNVFFCLWRVEVDEDDGRNSSTNSTDLQEMLDLYKSL